jgi:DNA-binding winged helix-turn-helix (wHTH) protein
MTQDQAPLAFGPLRVNLQARAISVDGEPIKLTPYEFACLSLLLKFRGRVVTFKEFKEEVWRDTAKGVGMPQICARINTILYQLKRKLGPKPDGDDWIKSARQIGYIFDNEENGESAQRITVQPGPRGKHDAVQNMVEQAVTPGLPSALEDRITALQLLPEVAHAVKTILVADSYPTMMALSADRVLNPIWRFIPENERQRLAASHSPFGAMPPRIMDLDIFLLRANDTEGRPLLLHYFSNKPISGWQAYMLLFRHKKPAESEDTRQIENAKDIASYLLLKEEDVAVRSLGDDYVVSVKPDPGYSELVLYIFHFCVVTLRGVTDELTKVAPELKLEKATRRLRWIHPEEMELRERTVLVDGDVVRGVHYFFGTTIPSVDVGFPVPIPLS